MKVKQVGNNNGPEGLKAGNNNDPGLGNNIDPKLEIPGNYFGPRQDDQEDEVSLDHWYLNIIGHGGVTIQDHKSNYWSKTASFVANDPHQLELKACSTSGCSEPAFSPVIYTPIEEPGNAFCSVSGNQILVTLDSTNVSNNFNNLGVETSAVNAEVFYTTAHHAISTQDCTLAYNDSTETRTHVDNSGWLTNRTNMSIDASDFNIGLLGNFYVCAISRNSENEESSIKGPYRCAGDSSVDGFNIAGEKSITYYSGGSPVTETVWVYQTGSFTGTVNLSTSNCPNGLACGISPSSVTVGETPVSSTLTIFGFDEGIPLVEGGYNGPTVNGVSDDKTGSFSFLTNIVIDTVDPTVDTFTIDGSSSNKTICLGSEVEITWDSSDTGGSGVDYTKVFKSIDSGSNWTEVCTVNSSSGSCADSPVVDTIYGVHAIDHSGNEGTEITSGLSTITVNVIDDPAAPSNLTFSNIGQNAITLNWTDESSNESEFRISRNGSTVYTTSANVEGWTNSGLNENTNYSYQIIAYNMCGQSASDSATSNWAPYMEFEVDTSFTPGDNSPVANFTYCKQGDSQVVEFTNTSTDADENALSYSWNFDSRDGMRIPVEGCIQGDSTCKSKIISMG